MNFRSVFLATFLGTVILLAAFLINARRPLSVRSQPSGAFVEATGKCAECHRRETGAVVHEYEMSRHAASSVTCLDCHRPAEAQESLVHNGFVISKHLTSKNCATCHATEYDQFARSRHAAPSWAAVNGAKDFTPAQLELGEKYHQGWVNRPANPIGALEGNSAIARGCNSCHSVGAPNADGSFGTCTNCHARHVASVALAREPSTCGQCHMGPDHSQIEIYEESKHGALFAAQHEEMHLSADPKHLTTADMPVPTCATCHMSGLEGMNITHDVTERLSWFLFAPVSTKRPGYTSGQTQMKEICTKCHARDRIDDFYAGAESVLQSTNEKVQAALAKMDALRAEGLVSKTPFAQPIQFAEFDLWHYYGRTSKHGAFMGGADFVQWHGNYEILRLTKEIDEQAAKLRQGQGPDTPPMPASAAGKP
jgi:hydroxylamine dehydrogenase